MRLQVICFAVAAASASAGCFDSHGASPGFFDGGADAAPPMLESCGDGVLDARESCDDGNTQDGDGCDAFCRWETFCGDGVVDGTEACDDGNNRSGDGCRSDCASDETCGNGLLDVVAGEACDDGNTRDGDGCSGDCRRVESCGDGVVDEPLEQCDDGNTDAYDGCGPSCRVEVGMAVDSLAIAPSSAGCDFTGDGEPDNALAESLGFARSFINDTVLMDAVDSGELLLLMQLLGLDDLTGADDDALTVRVAPGELTMDGYVISTSAGAAGTFESRIAARSLEGGPDDLAIPVDFLPLELERALIQGTTTAMGGDISGIDEGALCGAIPVNLLASVPNILASLGFGGGGAPCDGSTEGTTLADLLVGGAEILVVSLPGTAPDVDVDGDGLEQFEVTTDGPEGCQPVITACIDGDGTRVEGRDCAADPRFADGLSLALGFTAERASIVGEN
ncbi:MAG: DUF4215 domain-containing protein [Myxococcota bacterium]